MLIVTTTLSRGHSCPLLENETGLYTNSDRRKKLNIFVERGAKRLIIAKDQQVDIDKDKRHANNINNSIPLQFAWRVTTSNLLHVSNS